MKYIFKVILTTIVLVECFVIVFFGYNLYVKKRNGRNLLKAATIVPVQKDFFVSSPSAGFQYFYESAPNMQQEDKPSWLPYKAVYTINSDTLNERYDYNVKKPMGVFRIVTLGDSFTFGQYVNTENNWTEELEDMLNEKCTGDHINKIEVINLGERGYDVKYTAHRYLTRGLKYQPDLVIWLESGSGFTRLRELYGPLMQKFVQLITKRETSNTDMQSIYAQAWKKAAAEVNRTHSQDQIDALVRSAWEDFFKIRGTTKTIIATFSNEPKQDYEYFKLWTAGKSNMNLFFGIRAIWLMNGVFQDAHPNVYGHTMIAEDIFTHITQNGVIPCAQK